VVAVMLVMEPRADDPTVPEVRGLAITAEFAPMEMDIVPGVMDPPLALATVRVIVPSELDTCVGAALPLLSTRFTNWVWPHSQLDIVAEAENHALLPLPWSATGLAECPGDVVALSM
jgi:hypothetical protein